MHSELLSFFFNGDTLIRRSTDPRPLVKPDKHALKVQAHVALTTAMSDFLRLKPEASLLELAYALKGGFFSPPTCTVCGTLVKFNRDRWRENCSISCALKNPQVKLKKRQSALEKWGVIHQFNRADTLQKKAEFHATQNITREKLAAAAHRVEAATERKRAKDAVQAQYYVQRRADKSAPYIAAGFVDLIFGKKDKVVSVTCAKCRSIFTTPRTPQCFICHAPARESLQWRFMQQFPEHIRDLRIPNGDRKFKLDATWEDRKLAIEFNGLYWHSSAPQPGGRPSIDKAYHQTKMLAAKSAGYRLIMVWEDQAKCEKYCRHLQELFVEPRKISARKCTLVTLTTKESRAFLNEHHRDGSVTGAGVHLGLEYCGELVSVATFGRNRFKGGGFEIFRLATKLGTLVVGGVSRLIHNFRKENPTVALMTFSDAQWGWGSGYSRAGGKLVGLTAPGYFYYDAKNYGRAHRLKLRRANFEKFTGIAWDETLNEADNAARAKCYQVWNCGNWKFWWPAFELAGV